MDPHVIRPLSKRDASLSINSLARDDGLHLHLKFHAKERLKERDLDINDVLKCMKYGFVYEEPRSADVSGYFRYKVEGPCHDEDCTRQIAVVVILPAVKREDVKEVQVITVMWADEK